jgi:hypothetical protein
MKGRKKRGREYKSTIRCEQEIDRFRQLSLHMRRQISVGEEIEDSWNFLLLQIWLGDLSLFNQK